VNVGQDLKTLIDKYSLGLTCELEEEFTYDVYQQLVTALFYEKCEDSEIFNKFHEIIASCLEILYVFVINSKTCKSEIEKLKKIIEELKNPTTALLSASSSVSVVAQIRPEIKLYIQKYGFPYGGLFEANKLNEILKEINII
jgi:hypothetical protein